MNEPLTLEQLKNTLYSTVYVVVNKNLPNSYEGWCKVSFSGCVPKAAIIFWIDNHAIDFGSFDDYGKTWLAYRRPPEGEEER